MKNTVAIIAVMVSMSAANADERNLVMADQMAALAAMVESEQAPAARYEVASEARDPLLSYNTTQLSIGLEAGFDKGAEFVGSAVGVTRRVTGSVLTGIGSGFTKLGDLIK